MMNRSPIIERDILARNSAIDPRSTLHPSEDTHADGRPAQYIARMTNGWHVLYNHNGIIQSIQADGKMFTHRNSTLPTPDPKKVIMDRDREDYIRAQYDVDTADANLARRKKFQNQLAVFNYAVTLFLIYAIANGLFLNAGIGTALATIIPSALAAAVLLIWRDEVGDKIDNAVNTLNRARATRDALYERTLRNDDTK